MANDNKNGMIAVLFEVLKESTDIDHPAKFNKLGKLVSEKLGKDKPVDARTISGYIDLLRSLGFVIEQKTGGYYLEKRFLDKAETKLLCDQILFSTIIPSQRKEKIVQALTTDLSISDQNLLKSEVGTNYKSALQESLYKDTLNNTNNILDAIKKNKKITFQYGDYDEKKELKLKSKQYRVSPFQFLFEQGKYYIMCQTEEDEGTGITRNFRIDLMRTVRTTNTKRVECPIEENLTDYLMRQINMYSPDMIDIVLEVNAKGLRGLYDKLGLDSNLQVEHIGTDKYRAKFQASFQGTKFFVLQYLDQMTVIKPDKLKREVIKSMKTALEKYDI